MFRMEQKMDDSEAIKSLRSALEHPITRLVYLFLLRKDKVGIREVQRNLNLSSPSVASYHLTKLHELSIVNKLPDNSYRLTPECRNPGWIKLNTQSDYFIFKKLLIPKFLLVLAFFCVSQIFSIIVLLMGFNPIVVIVYLEVILSVGVILLFKEIYSDYRKIGNSDLDEN